MRRVLRVYGLLPACALATAACSGFGPFGRCPEGPSISDRQLVEIAVRKLVLASQSPGHPEWVRYDSVADFFARNPDCCFVARPQSYAGEPIDLPITGEIELAIRYKRYVEGGTPYAIRYVTAAPCPTDMDEGDRPLTAERYKASAHWPWPWRIE